MKEYMTSVFAVSALLSILSLVAYRSPLEPIRRLAFGMILLSVAASPAVQAVTELSRFDLGDLIPSADHVSEDNAELYEQAFADGIAAAVCDKFELRGSDVRVLTEGFSAEEWRAERIRVILSGGASFADTSGIERFINRLDIGECEAEIEIG